MEQRLTEPPGLLGRTFLNFPLELDLHAMEADIAVWRPKRPPALIFAMSSHPSLHFKASMASPSCSSSSILPSNSSLSARRSEISLRLAAISSQRCDSCEVARCTATGRARV